MGNTLEVVSVRKVPGKGLREGVSLEELRHESLHKKVQLHRKFWTVTVERTW